MWLVRHAIGLLMSSAVGFTQTFGLLIYGNFCATYFGILELDDGEAITWSTAALFGVFQVLAWMTIISHVRCVFTKPGKTPRIEPPDIPLAQLKFCPYCSQWKPPRTHHCRICGICVHRVSITQMDHHCKWVNNCIGVKTHKFFILFLLYLTAAGVVGTGVMGYNVCRFIANGTVSMTWLVFMFNFSGVVLGVFFILLGAVLLVQQVHNLSHNQVQLEQWQTATPLPVLYNQRTFSENIESIFGRNKWTWLLPLRPYLLIDFEEPLLQSSQDRDQAATPLCQKVLSSLLLLASITAVTGGVCVYFRVYFSSQA